MKIKLGQLQDNKRASQARFPFKCFPTVHQDLFENKKRKRQLRNGLLKSLDSDFGCLVHNAYNCSFEPRFFRSVWVTKRTDSVFI